LRKRSLIITFALIGGAERLVVDAALGLQNEGHLVGMYTSHHDQTHCFAETKSSMLHLAYHSKLYLIFLIQGKETMIKDRST